MTKERLEEIKANRAEVAAIENIVWRLKQFKDGEHQSKGDFLIQGYEVKREWCSDVHLAGLITIMEQRLDTLQKQFDEL